MPLLLDIHPEVRAALNEGAAVVALESTLISHGLPRPLNLLTALAAEEAVRETGAVPATIAILAGRIRVGLTVEEIEHLATAGGIDKTSRRDIAGLVAAGGDGATTVAATMICAHLAGIRIFATGGIGGVHRGAERSFDVSADLDELARTPVAVVCSGAKAILDIGKTLEVLETRGVPVIGYGSDAFPAFYSRSSCFGVPRRVDTPEAAARLLRAQRDLGLGGGMLIANPPPADLALDSGELAAAVDKALAMAAEAGIGGPAVTPYLLARLVELTDGRSLDVNAALIAANARLAGEIAVADAAFSMEDRP